MGKKLCFSYPSHKPSPSLPTTNRQDAIQDCRRPRPRHSRLRPRCHRHNHLRYWWSHLNRNLSRWWCRFECHLRSWWSPLIRNFQCCLPRLIHRIRRIQRSILHLFRSLVSRLIPLICCFCSKHIYHSYRRCRLIVACQSPEQHLCCPEQSRKLGQLESLECCFQRK